MRYWQPDAAVASRGDAVELVKLPGDEQES